MRLEITRRKRIVIALTLFVCYFLLLAPYIVHTNLSEVDAGIVEDLKIIPVQSLPKDVQDLGAFSEECTVLLVKDTISDRRTVIITEKSHRYSSLSTGDIVEITDKIIDWHVDWHAYKQYFFDESFSTLIVGNVEEISGLESSIEDLLSSSYGGVLYSLSQVIFLCAPLLLILYITLSFKDRLYLWNITAILALYSLEVFIFNIVGGMHHIAVSSGTESYFGYLFLVLIPFTLFFARYEESERGQARIKEYYQGLMDFIEQLLR